MAKNLIGLETKTLPFRGSQVTWAGEFPARFRGMPAGTKLLCFGTDDGLIHVKDIEATTIGSLNGPQNLEAINGIAFALNMMAVSTTNEVVITRLPSKSGETESVVYDQGAHGVIATQRGGFMAPMGLKGIMQVEGLSERVFQRSMLKSSDNDLYFYRIIRVGSTGEGDEVFACAGRKDGLLTLSVNSAGIPGGIAMNKGQSSDSTADIDIVDVCPLPSPEYPFAVLGLGIDNTLHFTFDIRDENPPISLRLLEMRGTGYTVLAAQGHVFVLTSEEFYILPDLGTRFHDGELEKRVTVFRNSVEAVDFSIAFGEYILLITEEGVVRLEISKIPFALMLAAAESDQAQGEGISNGVFETTPDIIKSPWESQRSSILEEVLV